MTEGITLTIHAMDGKVFVTFDKPYTWFYLSPPNMRDFAAKLIAAANSLDQETKSDEK